MEQILGNESVYLPSLPFLLILDTTICLLLISCPHFLRDKWEDVESVLTLYLSPVLEAYYITQNSSDKSIILLG